MAGIFYFDLPIALVLCFVFHLLVRGKLIPNLPTAWSNRFNGLETDSWLLRFKAGWLVVIISCLIGIGSHLLWDSFTHEHGYFVERLSQLKSQLSIGKYKLPIYKLLQHGSTIIGLIAIGCVVYKLPKQQIQRPGNRRYWPIAILIMVGLLCLRVLLTKEIAFGNLVVTSIAGLLLGILVASLRTIDKYVLRREA